jgi:hypothetical protein
MDTVMIAAIVGSEGEGFAGRFTEFKEDQDFRSQDRLTTKGSDP